MAVATVLPSPVPTTTTSDRPPRRPWSLAARSAITSALVLAAFLGLVGMVMAIAKKQSTLNNLHDRLQDAAITDIITHTDANRDGRLLPPDSPPQKFSQPGSGLYAVILGPDDYRWESTSAIGHDFRFLVPLKLGEQRFAGPVDTRMGRLYYFAIGVAFDYPGRKSTPATVMVAQNEQQFEGENAVYRRTLALWLSVLGVLLIALQLILLRWSLRPLRQVASELSRVEHGDADHLERPYPRELTGLTARINGFIDSERDQRARYRHTLADLAHSLKTPLAVIRSQLESADETPARKGVLDQVQRMNDLVAYQLARAATSGRQTFATAVPVASHAEDLVRMLEKVYATKNVLCEFDIQEGAAFHGELNDLLELMGNLLENAFKWTRHHVLLVVKVPPDPGRMHAGLLLSVEDDGPGIAPDQIEKVLQRGVRGDERVQGHGIGLSIVQDIVKAYHGELVVDRSPDFGGARFNVSLPPE